MNWVQRIDLNDSLNILENCRENDYEPVHLSDLQSLPTARNALKPNFENTASG